MTIEAVLFDLDHTLLVEYPSVSRTFVNVGRIVEELHGVDAEEFADVARVEARAHWKSLAARPHCLTLGVSSWEGLISDFSGDAPALADIRDELPEYRRRAWRSALARFGIEDEALGERLAEEIVAERRKHHVPFDDTVPCLEILRPSYSLGVVTNGAPRSQREKLERSGLGGWFDAVLVSGELGYGKPDPRVFSTMLERLGALATGTVMVGDSSAHDVAGAQGAGLLGIHLDRDGIGPVEGVEPDASISTLADLPDLLRSL